MSLLRVILLYSSLFFIGIATKVNAETPMVNKHLVKLLGRWDSPQGAVYFQCQSHLCLQRQEIYLCDCRWRDINKKKKSGGGFPIPLSERPAVY